MELNQVDLFYYYIGLITNIRPKKGYWWLFSNSKMYCNNDLASMSNYNKQHVLMQNSVFQLINHDLAEILPIRRKTLNIIFMAFSIIV